MTSPLAVPGTHVSVDHIPSDLKQKCCSPLNIHLLRGCEYGDCKIVDLTYSRMCNIHGKGVSMSLWLRPNEEIDVINT